MPKLQNIISSKLNNFQFAIKTHKAPLMQLAVTQLRLPAGDCHPDFPDQGGRRLSPNITPPGYFRGLF